VTGSTFTCARRTPRRPRPCRRDRRRRRSYPPAASQTSSGTGLGTSSAPRHHHAERGGGLSPARLTRVPGPSSRSRERDAKSADWGYPGATGERAGDAVNNREGIAEALLTIVRGDQRGPPLMVADSALPIDAVEAFTIPWVHVGRRPWRPGETAEDEDLLLVLSACLRSRICSSRGANEIWAAPELAWPVKLAYAHHRGWHSFATRRIMMCHGSRRVTCRAVQEPSLSPATVQAA